MPGKSLMVSGQSAVEYKKAKAILENRIWQLTWPTDMYQSINYKNSHWVQKL